MTTLDLRRCSRVLLLLMLGLLGCTPAPVPPPRVPDAAPGDATPTDVSSDAPPALPCGDGGVCSGGQRCDLARQRCVACLLTDHCGGATPVCASGRCVAATPCTSSRMCPGQVCDLASMRCVDCVADMDCDPGLRCIANVCAAVTSCRSSRDCSAAGLVCDTAAMRCVECVDDRDCAMGMRCNGSRACVAPTGCTPGVATCASTLRVRECNAMGVATERDCAVGELCMAGTCRALLCSPGAVSCESAGARRTCNADGMAYTVVACAAGEMCVGGECRAPGCVPGAASCASTSERRVCNADGRSFTSTTCPAGSACAGGACMASTDCPGGQTRCGAACVDLQRDTANCGRCANACPSGAACDAAMCAVATAPMNLARAVHAMALLRDGSVLAIGGQLPGGAAMRDVERYDPVTNRWEARAPMPVAETTGNAVVLEDGRVVVGGLSGSNVIQVYTPETNTWARLTSYAGRMRQPPLVAHWRGGRVYVFDAYGISWYDLAADRWTMGADLVGVRPAGFVCTPDPSGLIHVFPLLSDSRRAVFSTASNTWTLLPGSDFGHDYESVAFTPEGVAYGFGAIDTTTNRSLPRVRRMDFERNMATPLAPMRSPRSIPTVLALPGGRFLVTGGLRHTGVLNRPEYLNTAEIYTIATNTWR